MTPNPYQSPATIADKRPSELRSVCGSLLLGGLMIGSMLSYVDWWLACWTGVIVLLTFWIGRNSTGAGVSA